MEIVSVERFKSLNNKAIPLILSKISKLGGDNELGTYKLYATWHEGNSHTSEWLYIGITTHILGVDYFTSSGNKHYWNSMRKYNDSTYGCILSVVDSYDELIKLESSVVDEELLKRFGEYGTTPQIWNLRVGGKTVLEIFPDGKIYPGNWFKYNEEYDKVEPLSAGKVTVPGVGYVDPDEYYNNYLDYDGLHSTRTNEVLKLQYDEFNNFFSNRNWIVGYAEWCYYKHACVMPKYMPGSIYQFIRQASFNGYDCQFIIDHLPRKWVNNNRFIELLDKYGYSRTTSLKPLKKKYMYDTLSSAEGYYLPFAWYDMHRHGFRFGRRPITSKYHKDHKPRVYISAGWFSQAQEDARLVVKSVLDELGVDYFSPKDDVLVSDNSTDKDKKDALMKDIEEIAGCDFMIASTEGKDPGTLWECGAAYEVGTPVLYYFPHPEWKFNLMLAGTGEHVSFTREDLLESVKILLDSNLDFNKLSKYDGSIE